MRVEYPARLAEAVSQQAEPIDLSRLQDDAQRRALEQVRAALCAMKDKMETMHDTVERRTAVFSPAKGYSHQLYTQSCKCNTYLNITVL